MRFVIQEHHSRRLHYDFRLEMSGILKSWAIPKGPSLDPVDKRLAVMVDDHPLEYFDFEGIIPEGQYGAGPVVIWDMGEYSLLEGDSPQGALEKGRLIMDLHGSIMKGAFSMVKMKGRGDENWLLMKKKDEHSLPGWVIKQALTGEKKRCLSQRKPPCGGVRDVHENMKS